MERQTITIQTTNGQGAVRAEVYGLLAVHRSFNSDCRQDVTHIPTGKFVIRNLTRANAREFCRRAQALDWNVPEWGLKAYEAAVEYYARDMGNAWRTHGTRSA